MKKISETYLAEIPATDSTGKNFNGLTAFDVRFEYYADETISLQITQITRSSERQATFLFKKTELVQLAEILREASEK